MTFEVVCGVAALVLLCLVIPIARRALIRRDVHAVLIILALCVAYSLLAALFVVDMVVRQPLSATLRFARGYAAGIAVGLLISAVALWASDRAARRNASHHDPLAP